MLFNQFLAAVEEELLYDEYIERSRRCATFLLYDDGLFGEFLQLVASNVR